jgi:hypothetical protein
MGPGSFDSHTTTEQPVAKQTRSARPRSRTQRRPDGPAATLAAPQVSDTATPAAPRAGTSARQAEAHVSTRITTTDYGYVVGELKRIALLTVLIVAILLLLWVLVG